MRALLATGDPTTTGVTDVDEAALSGDTLIEVSHSCINFKDGLAIAARPGVIRDWPKVAGIDLVGIVAEGERSGERVLVNGWGLGESRHGGLAERARVEQHMLTRVPAAFTNADAAAIGTAGYTAALGVLAFEDAGLELEGAEVLVTGAAGGVGSIAIQLLASMGASVTALTGRPQLEPWLTSIGAANILDRETLAAAGKPLQKARWDAVADAVGGVTLANAIAQTKPEGHVTACGLAGGAALPSSVMPFILRGVTLHGIHSVEQPAQRRDRAWALLAEHLDIELLREQTQTVSLDEALGVARRILDGEVRGRVAVDVHA